jgi:hypothetical protein
MKPEDDDVDQVHSPVWMDFGRRRQTLGGLGNDIEWVWVIFVFSRKGPLGIVASEIQGKIWKFPVVCGYWKKKFSRGFDLLGIRQPFGLRSDDERRSRGGISGEVLCDESEAGGVYG